MRSCDLPGARMAEPRIHSLEFAGAGLVCGTSCNVSNKNVARCGPAARRELRSGLKKKGPGFRRGIWNPGPWGLAGPEENRLEGSVGQPARRTGTAGKAPHR